jgi:hypothetical protein
VTGDSRLVSVNPIRDTLFASNPDLYYLIGNVLTIAASLILTGGMAANAAVSAGTSIGRAVVTEYAKQGLTVAASSYVEKSMTEATNSPLAGFVVGSLTGMATYGTLSEAELEVVNNVKRPQQLGNVGESSSGSKPYTNSRPSYGKNQVNEVWENAKDPITGKVYDPSGVEITWDKTKPRNGQWDMGHIPGEKYSEMHQLYMDDVISKDEFLEEFLPMILDSMFYDILIQAKASEHSSRMIAMKNAKDNANKFALKLTLVYNKTRQT